MYTEEGYTAEELMRRQYQHELEEAGTAATGYVMAGIFATAVFALLCWGLFMIWQSPGGPEAILSCGAGATVFFTARHLVKRRLVHCIKLRYAEKAMLE